MPSCETACMTRGRVITKLKTIRQEFTHIINEDQRTAFLQKEIDFSSLAPSLEHFGLKRHHLTGDVPFDNVLDFPNSVSNNVVVDLEHMRGRLFKEKSFVRKWVKVLCISPVKFTDTQLDTKIKNVLKEYRILNKKKEKRPQLDLFLSSDFFNKPSSICSSSSSSSSSGHNKDSNIFLQNENKNLRDQLLIQKEVNLIQKEVNHDIMAENFEFNLKSKADDKTKVLLKRKIEELEELNAQNSEIKKSCLYKNNFDLKQKVIILTSEKEKLNDSCNILNSELKKVKHNLKSEQTLKSKYKTSNNDLRNKNKDLLKQLSIEKDENKLQLREGGSSHRYSDPVRKCFYALQGEANVSAINCRKVVSTVARELFNTDIKDSELPCDSTAQNLNAEMNVIALHQIGDEIKNSAHFTYACDGTSRQKSHFLEKHVVLSDGRTYVLPFSQIVRDDSDTLLESLISAFKQVCDVYCMDDSSSDKDVLFKEFIFKLKALMSDRASVMKCFDRKVAEFKSELLGEDDCSTHFLFCNAHFLLALSSAAEEAILSVTDGEKLGRDCEPVFKSFENAPEAGAVRVIHMTADVLGPRGDERHGCRENWVVFCKSKDINSLFSSYRSNRFNCLFQNASALLFHRDDIEPFLEKYAFQSELNLKLKSILSDLRCDKIMTHVAVLSFCHVFFTEPYWLLMNSKKTYFDFPSYVKKMESILEQWSLPKFDPLSACSVFPDFTCNTLILFSIFLILICLLEIEISLLPV